MDLNAILKEVDSWPAEERVRLIDELHDRFGDRGDAPELSEAMKAELDRRIEEADRNPGAGIPWEVVKARARERFRG